MNQTTIPIWGRCFLLILSLLLLSHCSKNEVDCSLKGDNLSGRVVIGDNVDIKKRSVVVIEWSTDNFATVGGKTYTGNAQGLLMFGYSLCVPNDQNFVMRAYQDENANLALDASESHGIYDQTASGDGTFVPVSVPTVQYAWNKVHGIDLIIDNP